MKLFAVISLLLVSLRLSAATNFVASLDRTTVAAAVTAASDGDVLILPTGTSIWTSVVTITKGITLQSSNVLGAVLIDEVSRSASVVALLKMSVPSDIPGRISGIEFRPGVTNTLKNYDGVVQFTGSGSKQVRLDRCFFNGSKGAAVMFNGPNGVIDHNDFRNTGTGVQVFHSGWGGASYGDGSWADADFAGTTNMVVVESNTFTDNNASGAIDSWRGGRWAFRFNTVQNSYVTSHGTDTTGRFRGLRWYEIYGNTFDWAATARNAPWPFAIYLRGGTGIIASNVVTGSINLGLVMSNYRNTTNPEGYPWSTWHACLNVAPDGLPAPWDGNTDTNGYPALDQLGRGQGDLIHGDAPNMTNTVSGIKSWPNQALDPLYQWANTVNGNPVLGSHQVANIVSGRDWTNAAKVGWTPLVFPHPLVTAQDTMSVPAAPSGLGAVAASSSQINLSWTDNSSDESGFKIERSLLSGSGFNLVATVAAGTTSYNDSPLQASTTYYYRVAAFNGAGNSDYSNTANATTSGGGGSHGHGPKPRIRFFNGL